MTPQRKLCVANVFMIAGLIPLLLGVLWILSAIAYLKQHPGQGAGNDAFMMIAVLLVTYCFAFIVSGVGTIWSSLVQKRNAGIHARWPTIIRRAVFILLMAPLLCYLGLVLYEL